MQLSGGPPCVGGAAKGEDAAPGMEAGAAPNEEDCIGALPKAGDDAGALLMELGGAAPFTGGKAGSFDDPAWPGNGAGNAPCAKTCPVWNVITATIASGAISWRIIKAIPSGPQPCFPIGARLRYRNFTIAASG